MVVAALTSLVFAMLVVIFSQQVKRKGATMPAKCPGRLNPACTCTGTCQSARFGGSAASCKCLVCAASSTSRRPLPRGSGSGITGFAEAGQLDFDPGFDMKPVTGLRQWTLLGPDFRNDPHQADYNWEPAQLAGATGFRWPAGVLTALCNNGYAHESPAETDKETGQKCGCVSPETRVLTADLRWVPAGDLVVGEHLVAFDEHHDPSLGKSSGRRYRDAVVANTERGKLPCYDLLFEDGTAVRVSADHRWLCYDGNKGAHWVRTDELRAGDLRASHVVKPFIPWETDLSREAGYLAGAFDGEGSLTQIKKGYAFRASFAQSDNPMLAETERCLKALDINYNYYAELKNYQPLRVDDSPRLDMYRLTVAGKPDLMRLLGSVRPVRLLPKFQPGLLGRLNMGQRVRLVQKAYVGEREVVMLGTTAGTYFAEGLSSHNCGFWAYWDMTGLAANRFSVGGQGLPVLGVVAGFGRVLVGERGFRSEKAEIIALAPAFSVQPELPLREPYGGRYEEQLGLRGGLASLNPLVPDDDLYLSWTKQQAQVSETEKIRKRAQQHADAWMAVIQDRLGQLYPGAQVFATAEGLLASVKLEGKPR